MTKTSVIREVLDLPAEVRKSDFVVRLADGIQHPEILLRDYAITPDLHAAYDQALTSVRGALTSSDGAPGSGRSVASWVHGSFGSGKSHFMAILSLLLDDHPVPWAEPAFHDLREKHGWVKEKQLLRLHFHMIGARSIEEKVFAAYLEAIRTAHPDADLPALFEDEALFDNAERLRSVLGDERFFEEMNAAAAQAKGWGKLEAARRWDRQSFDAARASTSPDERAKLLSALVKSHFPAFASTSSRFVGFDEGLGMLSRHAGQLGYDGVVLFLDEIILWLATRAAERAWLTPEAAKLAKLVEAQDERREVPIISFVARQRRVAEMVGDQFAGVDAQNLWDSIKWLEDRLGLITLGDQNLPAVVEKRVVRPRDPAARARLDEAFGEMRRGLGTSAWATLLGDLGDEKAFRQVYPFSPALLRALVALSHYLQRERTALRVLVELLVEHLEDFQIGRLVPIGDFFDVLAGGEEPVDGAMRAHFARAKRLYHDELLPLIQAQNGTGTKERCQRRREEHPERLGCSNCAETRCRADNRLAKTLLLGALVPETPVLGTLTASRLVQLNHGTMRSPAPGAEAQQAASRVRSWAAQVGKVRVGEQPDPVVQVVLEGVDLRPVLDAGRSYLSPGARRRKLQEVLFAALAVETGTVSIDHEILWRGCRRGGIVHYGNVREMEDAVLVAEPDDDFKVVVDYPFDDPGRGPEEDEARVARYLEHGKPSPTIVWLPSFFADRVQRDLDELCVIDRLLEGDSLRTHMPNARPEDLAHARIELQNLSSQKRQRVSRALASAYGIRTPEEGELDLARSLDRHFHVLAAGHTIRNVRPATLADALRDALCHLLEERYPRHPHFGEKVTRSRLEKNLERFAMLCEADGQRMAIGKNERPELQIAEDLGIVTLTETSASLRAQRFADLDRALAAEGIEVPTVRQVRRLLDPEGAMGLTDEVSDFLVLTTVACTGRELLRCDAPLRDPVIGKIPDDAQLARPDLPDPASWQRALDRAAGIFGISIGGRARHGRNLRLLSDRIAARRKECLAARAGEIASLLLERASLFDGTPPRLVTARCVGELLDRLGVVEPEKQVEALAGIEPVTSEKTVQKHILQAARTAECLSNDLIFRNFEALRGRAEPDAREVLAEVRRVLEADQINEDLAPRLHDLALRAQRILHQPPVPPPEDELLGQGSGSGMTALDGDRSRMRALLESGGDEATLTWSWRVTRRRT